MHLRTTTHRPAYTLIELAVVISIIVTISSILIVFYPSAADRRVSNGADKLRMALYVAKQRAFRDNQPTGVRLYVNGGNVTEVAYIVQPDLYQNGNVQVNATTAIFSQNLDGIANSGDILELRDNKTLYKLGVGSGNNWPITPTATTVYGPGTNWVLIRQPQPLAGEQTILLPQDVSINGNNCRPTLTLNTDIMFSPRGQVVGALAAQTQVILWLEDSTNSSKEKVLLAINTRTGRIGMFPVGGAGEEYKFVTDGSAGGL